MKIYRLVSLFILCTLALSACAPSNTDEPYQTSAHTENTTETYADTTPIENENKRRVLNYEDMKAMWLSQFDLQNIYSSGSTQRSKDDFTQRIKQVLSNVSDNGFNTVILQTRPYADSFYPSEIYPPSRFVTGDYGNSFRYDPVAIIIEEAHSLGLSIHAWVNPMRAMTAEEIKSVDSKYPIKSWYTETRGKKAYLPELNGRLYLDPAYPEVREMIINGIVEELSLYDFDGVHMDDYFYPTTDGSFDKASYEKYINEGGTKDLKNFRYENLNELVSGIYTAVKAQDERLLFGISPEGNISNVTDKAFADVYKWCSEDGYIDYICPQIYFGLEHATHPFDKIADQWSSVVKNRKIKLMIGMTLGKALSKTDKWAGSGKDEWAMHTDILKRCLEYTRTVSNCHGVFVFCYQYFYEPSTAKEVMDTAEERNNFIPLLKEIQWENY